jgi:glyoxylase-like metal-dependent hydrolase (beta-lactamase superfamily II)
LASAKSEAIFAELRVADSSLLGINPSQGRLESCFREAAEGTGRALDFLDRRTTLFKKLNQVARVAIASLAMAAAGTVGAQQWLTHRNAATLNTGGDMEMMNYPLGFYCNEVDGNTQLILEQRARRTIRLPLTPIYDNVWYIGSAYVGAFIIKTADGLVMVDTGNNTQEVLDFIEPALKSLGLSPSFPLKGIFLSHGHGDHDGGAMYLHETYGAPVFIGSADAAGKPYSPTTWDSTDHSVRTISIGGMTFTITPTPGHTPGSTTAVVTVKDSGQDVNVVITGGSNIPDEVPGQLDYLDSVERTYPLIRAMNVQGGMHPHPHWDGTIVRLNEIIANGRSSPGQYIYGNDTMLRRVAVIRECAAAQLIKTGFTGAIPVWRVNKIEFLPGSPTVNNIAARLTSGWGPTTNQSVTFATQTGASCAAVTDSGGFASCALHPLRTGDKVTASFAGAESSDFVDLPADASANVCSNGNCKDK